MSSEPINTDSSSAEIAALKNQLFILLVALIVVSGTLTVVLYRQATETGKQIEQTQQALEMVAKQEKGISAFVEHLVMYAEKHPDFVPVLKKYGLVGPNGALPLPPPGAAAPAALKK